MADGDDAATVRPTPGYVVLGAALVVALILGFVWRNALFGPRFDSAAWKNAASHAEPTRIGMIDNLLWRYDLVGMARNDVDELLGTPEPTDYFRNYDYVYWLGPERGFISIDSEWLALRFSHDKVSEAAILTD